MPVRRDLRVISAALVGVTCLMLAAGTVVTGTGPLAGDAGVARYHLPLEGVTQLHADIGWLLAGLSIALVLVLRLSGAPPRAVRAVWIAVLRLYFTVRERAPVNTARTGPAVTAPSRQPEPLDR
jgi:cytochrome c oxidase assembly protein subunit 15